jgi:hypothetical protein
MLTLWYLVNSNPLMPPHTWRSWNGVAFQS